MLTTLWEEYLCLEFREQRLSNLRYYISQQNLLEEADSLSEQVGPLPLSVCSDLLLGKSRAVETWRERDGGGKVVSGGKTVVNWTNVWDKRLPRKLLLSKSSEKNKQHWASFGLNIEGHRVSETALGELQSRESTVHLRGSRRGQRALFECGHDNGLPGLSALVIWTFLTLKHLLLELLKMGKPVLERTELTPELLCFTANYLRLSMLGSPLSFGQMNGHKAMYFPPPESPYHESDREG